MDKGKILKKANEIIDEAENIKEEVGEKEAKTYGDPIVELK